MSPMCRSISIPRPFKCELKGPGRFHTAPVHRQRRSPTAVKGCSVQRWYCFVYTAHWDRNVKLLSRCCRLRFICAPSYSAGSWGTTALRIVVVRRCLKFAVRDPPGLADSVIFENPNRVCVVCLLFSSLSVCCCIFSVMLRWRHINVCLLRVVYLSLWQ